jgi:O-antigen ligase
MRYASHGAETAQAARRLLYGLETAFVFFALFYCTGALIIPLFLRSGGESYLSYINGVFYIISAGLLAAHLPSLLRTGFQPKVLYAFLFLVLASYFWSPIPSHTLQESIGLVGTTLFALYASIRFPFAKIFRVVYWVCISVIAISFFFGLFLPQYGIMSGAHSGAWMGPFTQKNTLGGFAAFSVLIFALNFQIAPKQRASSVLLLGLAILLVLLSRSTTSLVAVASLLAFLPLLRVLRRRPLSILATISLSLAAATLLTVLAINYAGPILGMFGKNLTLTGRTDLWNLLLEAVRKQPLLGYGYSGFWNGTYEAQKIRLQLHWEVASPHNGLLGIILQLGLVGAFFSSWLFISTFAKSLRYVRACNNAQQRYWPAAFLFYVFLENLTEYNFATPHGEDWILLVITIILLSRWPTRAPESSHSSRNEGISNGNRLPH